MKVLEVDYVEYTGEPVALVWTGRQDFLVFRGEVKPFWIDSNGRAVESFRTWEQLKDQAKKLLYPGDELTVEL